MHVLTSIISPWIHWNWSPMSLIPTTAKWISVVFGVSMIFLVCFWFFFPPRRDGCLGRETEKNGLALLSSFLCPRILDLCVSSFSLCLCLIFLSLLISYSFLFFSFCQLFILGSLFCSSFQSLFSLCFSVSLSLLFLPLTFDFCLTLPSFLIIVFHFNRLWSIFIHHIGLKFYGLH